MKKYNLKCISISLLMSIAFSACNSSAGKVEKARENAAEANKNLDEANQIYLADIESYRRKTTEKIETNENSIAWLNAGIENERKEVRVENRKKIAELEQKNRDLKMKMNEYKADGNASWEKFKAEFDHDIDVLGKAIADLTVKNTE
jgi:hypothetical protein